MTNNVKITSSNQCEIIPSDGNTPTIVIANYDNSDAAAAAVILYTDNKLSFFPELASSCEGAKSYLEYILDPEMAIEAKVNFTCDDSLAVVNAEGSYSVSCDFI